jgi:hypothetical protein
MQRLLQLANGRNPKRYYAKVLREIREATQRLELLREYRLGESRSTGSTSAPTIASGTETKIRDTLNDLVPTLRCRTSKHYETSRPAKTASRSVAPQMSYGKPCVRPLIALRQMTT